MRYPSSYIIGRNPACDVVLEPLEVSNRHAELSIGKDNRLFLTDCGSSNGTYVLRSGEWKSIRQAYVEPSSHVKFGDHDTTIGALMGGEHSAVAPQANHKPSEHEQERARVKVRPKSVEQFDDEKPVVLDEDGNVKNVD